MGDITIRRHAAVYDLLGLTEDQAQVIRLLLGNCLVRDDVLREQLALITVFSPLKAELTKGFRPGEDSQPFQVRNHIGQDPGCFYIELA